MAKIKEFISKHFKSTMEMIIILALGSLITYILLTKTPTIFDKSGKPLKEITHRELDIWMSLDGKIILVDKATGGLKVLSDSLATDIMLVKLKFYYTDELRKAGKLSEIDNIDGFFKRKP